MRGYQAVRLIKDFILGKGLSLTQIVAIGTANSISNQSRSELEDCGVSVQQVAKGQLCDTSILHELIKIVYFYRPPHSIVLISGDRDFSKILNFLDQVHYHVVYVHAKDMSDVMQFSITDRTSWWDLLGCQVSDIDFVSHATILKDMFGSNTIIKSGANSIANTTISSPLNTLAKAVKVEAKIKTSSVANPKAENISESSDNGKKSQKSDIPTKQEKTKSGFLLQKNNLHPQSHNQSKTVNYDVVVEFLNRQDNFTSFFGDIGANCRKIASMNGFSTLKDYLYQAETDGIVLLSNKDERSGHVLVKLAPHLCVAKPSPPPPPPAPSKPGSNKMFDDLVALLESRPSKSMTMADIGISAKNISKRHGFSTLKAYMAVAEQAGLVKTSGKDDRNGKEDRNGRIMVYLIKSKSGENPGAVVEDKQGPASVNPAVARHKKAFWDLVEFLKSMPDGQYVSAIHVAKFCPSILRKSTYDSFQSLLYAAKNLGIIDLKIEGDGIDISGFSVKLIPFQSSVLVNLNPVKAGIDLNGSPHLQEKENQILMALKEPLFVPSATPCESLLGPGDLEMPKSSKISIRAPSFCSDTRVNSVVSLSSRVASIVPGSVNTNVLVPVTASDSVDLTSADPVSVDLVSSCSSFDPVSAPSVDTVPATVSEVESLVVTSVDFVENNRSTGASNDSFDGVARAVEYSIGVADSQSKDHAGEPDAITVDCDSPALEGEGGEGGDGGVVFEEKVDEHDESSAVSSVKYGTARFEWPHPGKNVCITGSWDGWMAETQMIKSVSGTWTFSKELPVGRYEYEFVVDGNSMVDDNQEYVEDEESCHNIVFVA